MNVPRFDIETTEKGGFVGMIADVDGLWIRFDDHQSAVSEMREQRDQLLHEIHRLRSMMGVPLS